MLHVGFGNVKTLAIRNKLISKLYQLSGYAVTPAAYRILCVRFVRLVHQSPDSATDATLDTGGWLALTRPGLSPGKMRQAYLGATTLQFTGPQVASAAPLLAAPVQLMVGRHSGSLDYLSRAQQDRLGDGNAEYFRGFQVDDEIEFCRLLDRQIARFGAFEDLVDVVGGATVRLWDIHAVG